MAKIRLLRDIENDEKKILNHKNQVVTVSDKHAKLMVSLNYAEYVEEKKVVKKKKFETNKGGS